jgi:uncharacterized membrane-anchored protein YhcB (DUF1043 family)
MTRQWNWFTGGIALVVAIVLGFVAWRLPGKRI